MKRFGGKNVIASIPDGTTVGELSHDFYIQDRDGKLSPDTAMAAQWASVAVGKSTFTGPVKVEGFVPRRMLDGCRPAN